MDSAIHTEESAAKLRISAVDSPRICMQLARINGQICRWRSPHGFSAGSASRSDITWFSRAWIPKPHAEKKICGVQTAANEGGS
ncbi:hypothetical protein GDO78_020404 [Eleutherodactylus coqui]|uniref:Uncharacterized protein n=1 Tax=Eleutherodactylus coqui TaxID=57060 RepID=A0A8J6BCW1_ELECQ|nr:hypothetical protein GDO78_020404 [Eleutherodactylus coqui]